MEARFFVGTLNGAWGVGDHEIPTEFARWGTDEDGDDYTDDVHDACVALNGNHDLKYDYYWETFVY